MSQATTGSDAGAAAVVPTGIEDTPQAQQAQQPDEQSGSPLDSILSRLDEYIQNPSRITRDTLMQLKGEIEDLKSGFDEPETPDQAEPMDQPSDPGSLSHDIMKMHMDHSGGNY